jgi:hypothetical protein
MATRRTLRPAPPPPPPPPPPPAWVKVTAVRGARPNRFHLHAGWLLLSLAVLGVALWGSLTWSTSLAERLAAQRRLWNHRILPLTTGEQEFRLEPSRNGVMTSPAITIKNPALMLDFHIDEAQSPYDSFRVAIDRIDQGRVAVISHLHKDSEHHLRIELNSGALGPGTYQITIEGGHSDKDHEPRKLEPDSWVSFTIAPQKEGDVPAGLVKHDPG